MRKRVAFLLTLSAALLCMALALGQVAPRLRLFGAAARRPQMQQTLLGAVDELKTACVTPDALEKTAARCPGYLGDKLRDLALVLAAYDAVTAQGHADPTDRLTRLAERIPASALGRTGHFYLDGFTDYTRQELAVVRVLLAAGKMHASGVAGEGGEKIMTPADAEAFMAAGADIILLPAPGTVPGITQEYAHRLIEVVHSRGKLALTAIGTSQEGADVATIRQIALMCKMAGADIHHIGDTGVPGMALPQNIMAYSIAIRGERHTYHKMAQSVNR